MRGLFDIDDSRSLDELEFAGFVTVARLERECTGFGV